MEELDIIAGLRTVTDINQLFTAIKATSVIHTTVIGIDMDIDTRLEGTGILKEGINTSMGDIGEVTEEDIIADDSIKIRWKIKSISPRSHGNITVSESDKI